MRGPDRDPTRSTTLPPSPPPSRTTPRLTSPFHRRTIRTYVASERSAHPITRTKPPTPRRCRRILEAHHLWCQGCSAVQIARTTRMRPLHRLRLSPRLPALPRPHPPHRRRRPSRRPALPPHPSRHPTRTAPTPHRHHSRTAPPAPQPARHPATRIVRIRPESAGLFRNNPQTDSDSSRQIWTDLDKSGLEFEESPVPSSKSPKIIPKSRPPNEVRKILPDDSNDALADAYRGRLLVRVTPVHLAEVQPPSQSPA